MDIVFHGHSDSCEVEDAFQANPCFGQLQAPIDVLRNTECTTLGKLHLTRPKEPRLTFDLSDLEWLSPSALVLACVAAVAAAKLGKTASLKVAREDSHSRSPVEVLCRSFGVGPALDALARIVSGLEPAAIDGETEQSSWRVNLALQVVGPDAMAGALGALKQEKLQSELHALLGHSRWRLVDADEIADSIAYEILDNAFSHAFRGDEARFAIACAYTRDRPRNTPVEEYFNYRKKGSTDCDRGFYEYLEGRMPSATQCTDVL